MAEINDEFAFRGGSPGILNFNMDTLDNVLRAVSLNSPAIKMALFGTGAYFAGKALTPMAARLLSPSFKTLKNFPRIQQLGESIDYDEMYPEDQESLKSNFGGIAAALTILPTLIHNFDYKKPLLGYAQFPEKESYNNFLNGVKTWLQKDNSALDLSDPMQAIPLSMAKDTIMSHPTLTPMTKATSMGILNTFPENSNINGKSVIDRAVSTGIDFLAGGALGAITAHAIGLPNPYTTGILTGTLNTLF